MKTIVYLINDIDCEMYVEPTSKRKEIFDWYDGFYDGVCGEDDSFEIMYQDGHTEFFCGGDLLPKISRRNIVSMVYANASSYIVYGNYEISECGNVYASRDMKIDENIVRIQ